MRSEEASFQEMDAGSWVLTRFNSFEMGEGMTVGWWGGDILATQKVGQQQCGRRGKGTQWPVRVPWGEPRWTARHGLG